MSDTTTQLKENARVALQGALDTYKQTKDVNDLVIAKTKVADYMHATMDQYIETPIEDRNTLFSFDVSLVKYLTVERIFYNGSLYGRPAGDVILIPPTWNMVSELGEHDFDDEVNIPLLYDDPSALVSKLTLVGELPFGVELNSTSMRLYGYVEDTTSKDYSFTIIIHTTDNKTYPMDFTMSTKVTNSTVEWVTDPDLGTYLAGSTVNQSLDAYVIDETL